MVSFPPTDLSKYEPDDIEHVGWWYEAIRAEQAIWMEPYYNQNNHTLMVSYVIPLYKEEVLVGVVGMDIDFAYLISQVNEISVYQEGRAYLVGSDGEKIYNSRGNAKQRIASAGEDFAVSKTPLNNGMELWILAAYHDIQQDSYATFYGILTVCLIVMILFAFVTIVLTGKIISPLKKLTMAVEQMSEGKMDIELETDRNDEIGTLSRAFQNNLKKLQENISAINALAYKDSLTGIRNHAAYTELAEKMQKKIEQGATELGVMVTDVNNLKTVNDTYGHEHGNELIIRAAEILCRKFKCSPVFRIGGDEFVVILENRDLKNCWELIQSMDDECKEQMLVIEGKRIPISIARGVAIYDPLQDQNFEDVFIRADHEMYLHKQMSKDIS